MCLWVLDGGFTYLKNFPRRATSCCQTCSDSSFMNAVLWGREVVSAEEVAQWHFRNGIKWTKCLNPAGLTAWGNEVSLSFPHVFVLNSHPLASWTHHNLIVLLVIVPQAHNVFDDKALLPVTPSPLGLGIIWISCLGVAGCMAGCIASCLAVTSAASLALLASTSWAVGLSVQKVTDVCMVYSWTFELFVAFCRCLQGSLIFLIWGVFFILVVSIGASGCSFL